MSRKIVQEKDIQQARWDCKWSSLPEMIETWAAKATNTADEIEFFKCMILGEMELEMCFLQMQQQEVDREEKNVDSASKKLKESYSHFAKALSVLRNFKEGQQSCNQLELNLLLAKYHFALKEYESTLKYIKDSQLETDKAFQLPRRGCLLAAEALAYKGQALEAITSVKENEHKVIDAYRKSAEICLWLFTDAAKTQATRKSNDPSVDRMIPQTLLVSFLKPAEMELDNGNVSDVVDHYRLLLRAEETKATASLRKILALKLAEILVFFVTEDDYKKPSHQTWTTEDRLLMKNISLQTYHTRQTSTSSNKTTPKTQMKEYARPQSYGKDGVFCPEDEFEEALLLLLISESLLLQDACVSMLDEDKMQRRRTIEEANAIYDMLTLVLTKRKQYKLLLECIERGIKLAYREFHLWYLYALALICNEKYKKALVVMKKCHELEPENVDVLLHCAKLCINNLRQYREAIGFAEQANQNAIDILTKANCYLAVGLSNSLLADQALSNAEEKLYRKKAIHALEKAYELDPYDVDTICQLALNHALSKEATRAATVVNQAIKLDANHRESLLLLALVLSTQKKLLEALEVIDAALADYPEDFCLLQTKLHLTEECYGGEQALSVCQEMLRIWNILYAEGIAELNFAQQDVDSKSISSARKGPPSESKASEAGKSLMRLTFADEADGKYDEDEVSSITASVKLERNLSEIACSMKSGTRLSGPASIALLARIWLMTADVYLNMDNTEEASSCILEASSIFPVSPEVLYMRGRLNHVKENLDEAKACYECALAVSPNHVDSMENIAAIYHEKKNYVMAEKFLRDAIAVKPTNPFVWQALGITLQSIDQHDEAANCFVTALDLEATHPILPFTTVPRLFNVGTAQ